MTEGDIVLIHLPQSTGVFKLRPALLLKKLPKYNDFLVCGISSQIHQHIKNIDEIIDPADVNFAQTGLHTTSLIRLLFLAIVPSSQISGNIGKIPSSLHKQLLQRLCQFLIS